MKDCSACSVVVAWWGYAKVISSITGPGRTATTKPLHPLQSRHVELSAWNYPGIWYSYLQSVGEYGIIPFGLGSKTKGPTRANDKTRPNLLLLQATS
jgi:hypothetical protein